MGKTAYAYFTKEHENGVKKANGIKNGFPIIPGKNEKRGKVRFPYTETIFLTNQVSTSPRYLVFKFSELF